MITFEPWKCKVCSEERYHRIIFMGGEFQYECPVCYSIDLCTESIYYRFTDNWKKSPSRYVGIWNYRTQTIENIRDEKSVRHFRFLINGHQQPELTSIRIEKSPIRNTQPGKFFIASTIHDHFQESLRGLVRLREHIEYRGGESTYNILICYDGGPIYNTIHYPHNLINVDEIWYLPYTLAKQLRWPYVNSDKDTQIQGSYSKAITQLLDSKEGIGEVISKRPGPLPSNKQGLKKIIEPPIQDKSKKKYIAIILRSHAKDRAELYTLDQISQVWGMIKDIGFEPIIIATNNTEERIVRNLNSNFTCLLLKTFEDQINFYKYNCLGVVGSVGSGCNLPALYELPMFIFVKSRGFPDDFYCFARMSSQYNSKIDWNGALEKAENIVEIKVPLDQLVEPQIYQQQFEDWYKTHLIKYLQHGEQEIELGAGDPCPICKQRNLSRDFTLLKADLCYEIICSKCNKRYISYRGLTTGSRVEISLLEEAKKKEDYEKALQLKITRYLVPINKIILTPDKDNQIIYYYSLKPSLSDLYYTLPVLIKLKQRYGNKYRIIAIIFEGFGDLVPDSLIDEKWLIKITSPWEYYNQIHSNVHYTLEKAMKNSRLKGITSNFPGTLPFQPDEYKAIAASIMSGKNISTKAIDVLVYCRLKTRIWPLEATIKELLKSKYTFLFLVFPINDQILVPEFYDHLPNVCLNPTLQRQLQYCLASKVCLTPHGASEVVPCITDTPIVELETNDPWWKDATPQPIRYGLSESAFLKLQGERLTTIPTDSILKAIQQIIGY